VFVLLRRALAISDLFIQSSDKSDESSLLTTLRLFLSSALGDFEPSLSTQFGLMFWPLRTFKFGNIRRASLELI